MSTEPETARRLIGGIVVGLYRAQDRSPATVMGWAEGFPLATARDALAILATGPGKPLPPPTDLLARVPDWAGGLGPVASSG